MEVFVLEYFVDYEGGGIIGVFATEEDAREAFWEEVARGEVFGGDGVTITRREVGKTSGKYNDEYDLVAEFEYGMLLHWTEVFDDES